MPVEPVPEPLATFLATYCDVEALELMQRLSEGIQQKTIPTEKVALFRQQFIDAIHQKLLTPEQFKAITGDNEYTTPEQLRERLCELWSEIFVGEEIPM